MRLPVETLSINDILRVQDSPHTQNNDGNNAMALPKASVKVDNAAIAKPGNLLLGFSLL